MPYRLRFIQFWMAIWILTILIIMVIAFVVSGYASNSFLATPNYMPAMFRSWPTATPTLTPGYLLITEVMYDPAGEEPAGEWIEVFNAGDTAVDISAYKLGDEEEFDGPEGMFQFPTGSIISPGEVIVIANRTDIFYKLFKL